MGDVAIRVEGLSKQYRLGISQPYGRLTESISNAFRAPFRRERAERDPQYIWALDDVNLSVSKGEVVGIIGHNGAGKTTLLKILSRITAPTRGRAEMHGRLGSLLEVGTGFHPELTGRENIFLNGAILGMHRSEIARKFDDIVAFAEIPKFIDTPVKRYSSGMYVRLAFAVAAHLEPEILLVDEVLAVGDATFQEKCVGKMSDVARGGRTVLFVSHNMGAIARLCTRTVLMENGRVTAEGPTNRVIETYMTSALVRERMTTRPRPTDAPMYIEDVVVLDAEGRPVDKVGMPDPFTVRIDYVVNHGVRGGTVACVISDLIGNFVVNTDDTDLVPAWAEPREPGRYRTEFSIPGGLLNLGQYELLIFTGVPKLSQEFDSIRNVYLTVDDTEGSVLYRNSPHRRSALALELAWRTEVLGRGSALVS